MSGKYLLAVVLVVSLCVACNQDQNKKSTAKVYPSAGQEQDQVFTQRAMDKINQVAGPIIEKVEDTSHEVASRVVEDAKQTKQRSKEFAAALKDEAVPVVKKTGAVLKEAGEKVETVAKEIRAPEKVEIKNKKGKVTLPHRAHGKMLGCVVCHGDQKPGAMELGMAKGHKLCKGCHRDKGKGPVSKCNGCHEKKIVAADEGC